MSESKNKLTIEQLKFAREIGAVYCSSSGLMYKNIKNRASHYSRSISEWVSGVNSADFDPACFDRIDFTPLDDLGSDNKEQPLEWPISEELIGRKVRFEGYTNDMHTHWNFKSNVLYQIASGRGGNIGPVNEAGNAAPENWGFKFTLLPEGYNPVSEQQETAHDVSHHKRKDGTDLIDEWWNKYEPEVARVLMWEMVNKYNNRLGKKDPVHIEVAKMADYMARWSEKEFELIK